DAGRGRGNARADDRSSASRRSNDVGHASTASGLAHDPQTHIGSASSTNHLAERRFTYRLQLQASGKAGLASFAFVRSFELSCVRVGIVLIDNALEILIRGVDVAMRRRYAVHDGRLGATRPRDAVRKAASASVEERP